MTLRVNTYQNSEEPDEPPDLFHATLYFGCIKKLYSGDGENIAEDIISYLLRRCKRKPEIEITSYSENGHKRLSNEGLGKFSDLLENRLDKFYR